jgi:hypothetical protein
MTVLPRQSQENLPNMPHLISIVGGGVLDFSVSPSPSCGPIEDAAGPTTNRSEWK